jgi:4-nitrophenyl phosphatase
MVRRVTWVLDLDGVIWLADDPIAGAAQAVAALRHRGEEVVFLTNNSASTVGDYTAKLAGMGIATSPTAVVTSALAAASLLTTGQRVLVCAGPGVEEALVTRGCEPVRSGPADAVIVGWHRDFDYARLTAATRAVMGGARLIGTNDDPTYPTPEGLLPGGGAILAAVAYATGVTPEVAGKPHDAIVELMSARWPEVAMVVGDRAETDGRLARRLGARFALVLTGVTSSAAVPTDPEPDVVAADLLDVVTRRT